MTYLRYELPKKQRGEAIYDIRVSFDQKNVFRVYRDRRTLPEWAGLPPHLIEATRGESLDRLLTEAIKAGRRRAVESLLAEIIPGLVSVQMLTDKAGTPEVHFEFDWGSVPVVLAGDGLHALTRLAYELATPKDALLLVEEPEVHMHPRALDAAARAMVETVRRGNQIVVSTHSLDLIDDLIRAAATAGLLDKLAVFRAAIVDGELRTSRFPGEEAQFARDQIEEDLR
jgi:hypothetical protein